MTGRRTHTMTVLTLVAVTVLALIGATVLVLPGVTGAADWAVALAGYLGELLVIGLVIAGAIAVDTLVWPWLARSR